MENSESLAMKEKFEKTINEIFQRKKKNCTWMTKSQYDNLLSSISYLKNQPCSEPRDYWLKEKYDILDIGGIQKLISKPVSNYYLLI